MKLLWSRYPAPRRRRNFENTLRIPIPRFHPFPAILSLHYSTFHTYTDERTNGQTFLEIKGRIYEGLLKNHFGEFAHEIGGRVIGREKSIFGQSHFSELWNGNEHNFDSPSAPSTNSPRRVADWGQGASSTKLRPSFPLFSWTKPLRKRFHPTHSMELSVCL